MDANTTETTMQTKTLTVTIRRKEVAVSSFAEAGAAIVKAVGRCGSNGYYRGAARGDHGIVRFNGEIVARISYNGRAWCATCDGRIDGNPATEQFPGTPCRCGNTDHGNALRA